MKIRKHSAQYWKKSGTNLSPIDLTANVGIGTDTPAAPLDVCGYAHIGKSADAPIKTLCLSGNLNFDAITNTTSAQHAALSIVANGAGSIPAGKYYYGVMFSSAEGDTGMAFSHALLPSIVLSEPSQVLISNIPTSSDPRVTSRKIYRSQAGTDGDYYFLYYIGTISDNTTTTYTDNSGISTTSNDWIYNKNNTTAGIIYRDGTVFGRLGDYVTAFGKSALGALTRGSTSAAFGTGALQSLTTGDSNDAFGNGASSQITTGNFNVSMGYSALQGNQTGGTNTAFGAYAVRNNTTSSLAGNSGFGYQALYGLTTSNNYNVGLGYTAGSGSQGNYGIYLGYGAGYKSPAGSVGTDNIAIGHSTGKLLGSGARNILLGYNIELASPTTNNQLNIGNLIFATGMDGTGTTLSTGKVGIGITSPTAYLHIKAGTAAANTAPLKLTSGTLNTSPEAGAIEFSTDDLYATITTGTARKGIVLNDGSNLTSGYIPIATTNGRLVDVTPQAHETALKTDYTTGDLDTEAKIISAINATNTTINSIITKLESLKLFDDGS